MYQISVFVPIKDIDKVKTALFNAGAGHLGQYDHCAWQTLGSGQFRALESSNPFIGEKGKIEQIEEYKLELVCQEKFITQALQALIEAHPYEEPAYSVYEIKTIGDFQR
ncbi:MAG: NGG1p interacting factor NIF3 [Gammaproteobacteria bacterium]|nr:NGG1p interacting factor NIF3 [Gammaproteobacteria bacterium]